MGDRVQNQTKNQKNIGEEIMGKKNEREEMQNKVMTQAEFAAKITEAHFNNRRNDNNFQNIAVADAVIEGKNLGNAEFHFAKMTNVRFSRCNLTYSEFKFAEFENVTFENCKMDRSYFNYAKMHGVQFKNCVLDGSEYDFADGDAAFESCSMENSEFNMASLKLTLTKCATARSEFNGCGNLHVTIDKSDFTRVEMNDSTVRGTMQNTVFSNGEFKGSNGTALSVTSSKVRDVDTDGSIGFSETSDDDDDEDIDKMLDEVFK